MDDLKELNADLDRTILFRQLRLAIMLAVAYNLYMADKEDCFIDPADAVHERDFFRVYTEVLNVSHTVAALQSIREALLARR